MKKHLLLCLMCISFVVLLSVIYDHCFSLDARMQMWVERENIEKLSDVLSSKSLKSRIKGIDMLAYTANPRAADAIVNYLEDSNPTLRKHVVCGLQSLSKCGAISNDAISIIAKSLQGDSNVPLSTLVEILGHSGKAEAIPHLIKLLKTSDDKLMKSAIVALGALAYERTFSLNHEVSEDDVCVIERAIEKAKSSTTNTEIIDLCESTLEKCKSPAQFRTGSVVPRDD